MNKGLGLRVVAIWFIFCFSVCFFCATSVVQAKVYAWLPQIYDKEEESKISSSPRTQFVRGQVAQFSGAYLYQICQLDTQGRELVAGGQIACQSYIAGVLDYHNLYAATGATDLSFCLPENISPNALQLVVLTYLQRRLSHHADFSAAPAVAMALYDSFPCRRGRNR